MNLLSFAVVVAAFAVLCCCVAANDECLALREMSHISRSESRAAGYQFDENGFYFCAATAPEQFRCDCSAAARCVAFQDPWGRDLGECVCCTWWVSMVFGFFLIMTILALLFGAYTCLCRNKWWCDGYPQAVMPRLPVRRNPVVAPSTMPLPPNLFRGYRTSDFTSGNQTMSEVGRRRRRRRTVQQQQQEGEGGGGREATQEVVAAAPARVPEFSPPQPPQEPQPGLMLVEEMGPVDDEEYVEVEMVNIDRQA